MGEKIARITSDKELMLANEIIEYPSELEGGGRNLIRRGWLKNNANINYNTGVEEPTGGRTILTEFIKVMPGEVYILQRPINEGNVGLRFYDENKTYLTSKNAKISYVYTIIMPSNCHYFKFIDEANTLEEGYKLERGTTPTPWVLAPEDLGLDYPDTIQSFRTGFLSDGTMLVSEIIEDEDGNFNLTDSTLHTTELIEDVDFGGDV